ncbi:hypothetical protein GN241_11040 [Rhodobacteraceae bacterium IMCC1335]
MKSGYVTVALGGVSYSMRPTYGVMRDIEARTEMTVQELLELVLAQRMKIEEAVLIFWYACQAAGEEFDGIEALGNVVFAERITSVSIRTSLSKFLLNCLYAPKDAQGKWSAEVAPMITSEEIG